MDSKKIIKIITESLQIINKANIKKIMHDTMNYILNNVITHTESKYGLIGTTETNSHSKFFRYHAVYGIPHTDSYIKDYVKNDYIDIHFGMSFHKKILETGEVQDCNNLSTIRKEPLPEGHPAIKVYVALPIKLAGEILGILVVARDKPYTEQDHEVLNLFVILITSLMKFIKGYLELDLHKNNFMANMSHELRTPLNGIVGISEMLQNTKLTKKQRDYFSVIDHCSIQLLDIVNDISDYSKISTGRMILHPRPISIVNCLKSVIRIAETTAKPKGLSIKYNFITDIFTMLIADDTRLKQILINIIDNAIKFTNKGGITIDIDVVEESKYLMDISFTVTDTGIGIPHDKLPVIFDMINQTNDNYLSGNYGVGLGLPIAKYLIGMFDGKINIESTENVGTTVNFTIKLRKFENEIDHDELKRIFQNKQALVISSNNGERNILFKKFSELGIIPIICASINDSQLYLKNDMFKFEFFIIDQSSLGEGSYDLVNSIRNCGTKVIIINEGDTNNIEYDYKIVRPMTENDLLEMLNIISIGSKYDIYNKPTDENVLFETTTEPDESDSDDSPETPAETQITKNTDIMKTPELKILIAKDNMMNQQVVISMLNHKNFFNIKVVDNGMELVNSLMDDSYDLVFVDLKMPKMNGIEAIEKYKGERPTDNTLIIALTASITNDIKNKCKNVGMNGFITKPINMKELTNITNLAIKKKIHKSAKSP